ncbi:hypothetical protein IQ230_00700 [Gloeocapsopsis crepidinum LEGE 06123]|uniref:Uncharacterized protein n=1 Tax=Gloeocapsopsis crepidinum LEGE 06123 TaxID=588587 RepID=A0ABR9UKU5_9CHRO|nr:hypothetical protein [Gloeocapsopsis crepidinum]MBE9188906.1 hypothetical protein [Gloeocapsopsis crepidinum LEGE 06123]
MKLKTGKNVVLTPLPEKDLFKKVRASINADCRGEKLKSGKCAIALLLTCSDRYAYFC